MRPFRKFGVSWTRSRKGGTLLTFNPQMWQTCTYIKSNKLTVATSEATACEIRPNQNSSSTEPQLPKLPNHPNRLNRIKFYVLGMAGAQPTISLQVTGRGIMSPHMVSTSWQDSSWNIVTVNGASSNRGENNQIGPHMIYDYKNWHICI